MTFRIPQELPKNTEKIFLGDDQYEFAQSYLTRTRRMLFLRGPIYPAPYPRADPFGDVVGKSTLFEEGVVMLGAGGGG